MLRTRVIAPRIRQHVALMRWIPRRLAERQSFSADPRWSMLARPPDPYTDP
jgi:hypothetical protein